MTAGPWKKKELCGVHGSTRNRAKIRSWLMNERCSKLFSSLPVLKLRAPTEMSKGSSIIDKSSSGYVRNGKRRNSLNPCGPEERREGNDCAMGESGRGAMMPPGGTAKTARGTEFCVLGPNWICRRPNR